MKNIKNKIKTAKDKKREKPHKKEKLTRGFLKMDNDIKKSMPAGLEAQNELQQSINRYANFYEFAPLGFLTLNDKGIITGINLKGAFYLGKEKKYIINTPFVSFIEISEVKSFSDYLKNGRLNDNAVFEDFEIISKRDGTLYLKLYISSFTDFSTNKLYYRVLMYDSEEMKAYKAFKESEILFSNLADNVPVLIWMFNKDHKLEYTNNQRFHFTGLTAEEEGRNWFDNVHPLDREIYEHKYRDAFNLRKKFSIEYRLKNFKNEFRWMLETTIPRFAEDNEFMGLIGTSIEITERNKARIALETSLKEKEVLIKEIHHRVKNNLQIVSSLLNLQSFYIKDPKMHDLLKGSQERIRSMALVHEKLYRSKDLLKIDFGEYAKELISNLFNSYRRNSNIRLKLSVRRIFLEINTAISLGLILNELVSNSLKHAFNGRREGEISITLFKEKKDRIELIVSDDGIGFPENFNASESGGIGLELVESLVQQHNGSMDIIRDGKTEFRISMEIKKEPQKNAAE